MAVFKIVIGFAIITGVSIALGWGPVIGIALSTGMASIGVGLIDFHHWCYFGDKDSD